MNPLKLLSGCRGAIWTYAMRCLSGGAILLALGGLTSLAAPTTLNVTNYGAKGDAIQFYVNTASNSVLVTTTNKFSAVDIGKTIEVFGVGKKTYGNNSYGVATNGWQDVIATVTNVVNATNLYLSVLPQDGATNYIPSRTMAAWATMGTDNMLAISNCIAAAPTNAIIYFPRGTYLMMPQRRSGGFDGYGYCAIAIRRGGLRFLGEDKTNTVLLSRGAWQSYFGYYGGDTPFRGFLFECVAPVTNDLPLIFENLTLDGGVQKGNLDVHGITANRVDGLGWDEQHSAYLTFDPGSFGGMASLQVFTNISVVRWRGESFKSIDQTTNSTIDIQGCTFADICATALNIYPRWNIRNNVFTNCWQITEYYQKFYRGTAYFCDNIITNSDDLVAWTNRYIGNAVSINGGIWTASPLIIQNNVLGNANGYGMHAFICTPAANVSFISNVIHCPEYSQVFSIGTEGSQGTDCNSNIVIAGNSIFSPGVLGMAFGLGVDGIQAVYDLTITNNYVKAPGGIQNLTIGNTMSKRIRFSNNNARDSGIAYIQTGVKGPNLVQYCYIETNNLYNVPPTYVDQVNTNTVSYASGPKVRLDFVKTGNIFILEDSTSNQIPAGASIQIDNTRNRWPINGWGSGDMSGNVIVYPSQKSGVAPMTLTNGASLNFYWTGSQWTTNQNWSTSQTQPPKPSPPGNLRVGQ